jgi:hypothetical protein
VTKNTPAFCRALAKGGLSQQKVTGKGYPSRDIGTYWRIRRCVPSVGQFRAAERSCPAERQDAGASDVPAARKLFKPIGARSVSIERRHKMLRSATSGPPASGRSFDVRRADIMDRMF